MPSILNIILDGDNAWPDLQEKEREGKLINLMHSDTPISLATLAHGTTEGRPTVTIRLDLPDGRVVLVETTLRLFLTAATAFVAKHGDPRH